MSSPRSSLPRVEKIQANASTAGPRDDVKEINLSNLNSSLYQKLPTTKKKEFSKSSTASSIFRNTRYHASLFLKMCLYYEAKLTYSGCSANPKHVFKVTKYSRCDEAFRTGYICLGAGPSIDANGNLVREPLCTMPGSCPRCH
ncbi:hypothetical protein GcC1_217017 [Golovinomyces cichoracearum]|uniref:Uncharacterized protein n=1 Tax=Golovinomyces cichoracearum TaxID=62708 RepID=A0A420H8Y7_9PEZI|nr:hypothetical protein GcC1_217017 [Golovinomyces cichoracearum]RKF77477.1 hypothetical protein GcM3_071015 [Golovinomyces cichoracearum]